ncbi:ABC transporter substrate-binding protein [Clostridium gasigenes]|uniref:ABC transporter substrate-binding protein n=1 Tax=Clostridium gasigenes TaxID=94869 RepID=UPI00143864E5|nr:ABC transporter substrate-binding protein [Clostridium gasigenes]NKF07349.1 ABC transporter substrate-binding protein [Clostridium gasigenes]QSW18322.1 ABC transporter substrate-binding protein [Clostridium gasigenes]
MKFEKLKAVALLVGVSLIVGCGTKEKAKENLGQNEKTLVYGSNDYTSINPAIYEHGEINSLIFTGLTAHDKENKIVPALAESWDFDKETNIYTFNLRDDVKWHDKEKFKAEDVKFTLETIMNPDNASEIASNYEDITSIEVIDDTTLKIALKAPNVAMLDYLTVGILPKHLLENKDIITDEFNKKPIGTGPFKLEKWDTGQSITLVKNPDYFKKDPSIDKVIFKIVNDSKAKVIQLKSGELDLAQVTPKDIATFEKDNDFNVNIMNTADYRGIMYNFNAPLFKENRELPNALSYAIDRQAIVDSVLLGHGKVAYSPLQMGDYNNSDIEKFDYNKEKAKSELEKSGWKICADGIYEKNKTKLSFEITCSEGDQVRVDMASVAAQQLKEIGVDAKVVVKAKIDWENQDSNLIGWGSPFDPDDHTYKVFGSNQGSNFNAYSNNNVDELLKVARETDVDEDRVKYYKKFQEEMVKDMPYTFFAYIDAIYVGKSTVKGITPETVLGHHGVGIFWNIEDWEIE